MAMTKAEIIASLLDQAQDKDSLGNGEGDNIFAEDAKALRAAAELMKKSEEVRHGVWKPVAESELTGWNPEFAGRDPVATYLCLSVSRADCISPKRAGSTSG